MIALSAHIPARESCSQSESMIAPSGYIPACGSCSRLENMITPGENVQAHNHAPKQSAGALPYVWLGRKRFRMMRTGTTCVRCAGTILLSRSCRGGALQGIWLFVL